MDETEMKMMRHLEDGDSDISEEEQVAAESADMQRSVVLPADPEGKDGHGPPGTSEESPEEFQFSSVQSLSHVRLFATPWTAACQASLFITNCQSSPKLMSIESVMPSNHLNPLSSPSPPALNLSQHQGLFK